MNNFDKEKFSKILKKIYNQYPSQRSFATRARVNRTYISKYINKKIDVPPSVKILRKLAIASKGVTTYQQLMQICGFLEDNEMIIFNSKDKLQQILELSNNLSVQEVNYLIGKFKTSRIQIYSRNNHEPIQRKKVKIWKKR